MVYILAFIGMVCWGISPIFAKIGLKSVDPFVGLSIRTFFTAGVVLAWMLIMACSPVVTIICSAICLNESITLTELAGACLTMIGIILII